ncbi:MAG: PadR family transcriptional regulator [Candidatus Thorarchaeota archaeon]
MPSLEKLEHNDPECEPIKMPHSIPRGLLKHVIIRLLHSGDLTGSDIMRVLDERSEGQWRPSPGSIYPLLSNLEEEGIIIAVKTEGRSKTYSLSKDGRARIKEILHKRGDVEHKARLHRMMLLQLLEPYDRVHFYISGFNRAINKIVDTIDDLTTSERRKIGSRMRKTSERLGSLIERVEQGET